MSRARGGSHSLSVSARAINRSRLSVRGAAGLILAALCWVIASPGHADDKRADAALQAGIRSFAAGAYAQALEQFLDARHQGMQSPALHYDLGVTYYKLRRDPEATAEFNLLLADPKFGDFARYNLGLTARRAGHRKEADKYFTQVAGQAHDTHLRALAQAELRGRSLGPHGWHGFIETAGGHDDNVALGAHNALLIASGAGSKVYSAMLGGGGWLTGGDERGLRLRGSLYDVRYPDQPAYNLVIAQSGPEYLFPVSSWRSRVGIYATHISLGGNDLETSGALNVRAEHAMGSARVRLDYRLDRVKGGPRFGYLTGRRNQLGVSANWHAGPMTLLLGYTLAINQRRDLSAGTQFFSASPLRNQFESEIRWNATLRTTYYVHGYYWWSVYRDPNVFLLAGALQERRRVDKWLAAEVGLQYHVSSKLNVTGEYGYRNNDSNIRRYAYSSHRVMLSLRYDF